MILIDTNIIIDFWHSPDDASKMILLNEDVRICGVVIAELLHGATSEKELDAIKDAISVFPVLNMAHEDWEGLGQLLYHLRTKGLTVPFQNAVIAYMAIKNNAAVWTKDKHFQLIRAVLPELSIMSLTLY